MNIRKLAVFAPIILLIALISCSWMEQEGAPLSSAPADLELTRNDAEAHFPGSINFFLDGKLHSVANRVILEYSFDKRAITNEVLTVEIQRNPGVDINCSWEMDLREPSHLPPGATLNWVWKITSAAGQTITTPSKSLTFDDPRYSWQKKFQDFADFYWSTQEESTITDLVSGIESKLGRIKLEVKIPQERKPKIFIYPSRQAIMGALPGIPQWAGAVASGQYNIILMHCDKGTIKDCQNSLAHELTHITVAEITFGPYGYIPLWLNEGIAEYAHGPLEEDDMNLLKLALARNRVSPISSLNRDFPARGDEAKIAYIESKSAVCCLLETGGWSKMEKLLLTFKNGSTCDAALTGAYGFDTSVLQKNWESYVRQWYLPASGEQVPGP
jgi:hypothetical protein